MYNYLTKILNYSKFIKSNKINYLGRWDTIVPETIKLRRVDLANIDSCGDEICSNPDKLIKIYSNKYYKSTKKINE